MELIKTEMYNGDGTGISIGEGRRRGLIDGEGAGGGTRKMLMRLINLAYSICYKPLGGP